MRYMTMRAAVSVRFDEEAAKRLGNLSSQTGISAADLIRRATEEYLDKIEAQGALTIPVKKEDRSTRPNGKK